MNSVVSSKPNALKHFMLYSAVSAISSMLPFPFKKAWKSARSILSNKEIKEENLYENTKKNFEYIDECF